jgi:NADH-quinone oxidoreductase subunit C
MEGTELEKILAVLREKYEDEILHAETIVDFPTVVLKTDKIVEIITHLYYHHETRFQFLTTLFGIHFPDQSQLGVVYQLHNMNSNQRLRLKIFVPVDKPMVPTLTSVFPAANWMERETYDFYGIIFQGHPNLTRILNVDEMIIFPLRKEYPLEDQVREDKNDQLFGR